MLLTVQRLLFPATLAVAVGGAWLALVAGAPAEVLPVAATLLSLVVVLPAERLLPRVGRAAEPGEPTTDLGFFALSAAVAPAVDALAAGLVVALAGALPAGPLAGLPLALGAALALLVGGLGDYWAHRLSHELPWWWRLHAVHHAPHRMVALNNFRNHPLDLGLKRLAKVVPVLVLGLSPEAVALAAVVEGVQVAFTHADVDLVHGLTSRLFVTNSVHRWHHSARRDEADANYGGVLSVYDQAFGTWRVPPESTDPAAFGLYAEGRYPVHRLLRALAAPFCWGRCVGT